MKQILIPFKENADIPESHFQAFRVCNSAGAWHYKQTFYTFKNQILEKYAREADYDLQHIVKKCYSCDGKGNHVRGKCWNCDKGVYRRKDVVLKRYILNGAIFHKPVGELFDGKLKIFDGYYEEENGWHEYPRFKSEQFNGKIINEINGLIKHEPMGLHPTWAFYYLLWNYNREYFYKCISQDVNSYQTRTKHKLKKMLERNNPLKVFADFFNVKKQHLQEIEDLPF